METIRPSILHTQPRCNLELQRKPYPEKNVKHLATRTITLLEKPGRKWQKVSDKKGCITCKRKRIKCDEAKPTCGQCEKRKLECDGYKLRYKWFSFDDTAKPPPGAANTSKKQRSANTNQKNNVLNHGDTGLSMPSTSLLPESEISWSPGLQSEYMHALPTMSDYAPLTGEDSLVEIPARLDCPAFDFLLDLEADSQNTNAELMSVSPITPSRYSSSYATLSDEEAIHDWTVSASPRIVSSSSRPVAPSSSGLQNTAEAYQTMHIGFYHNISVDHASPEMLLRRFDIETCGILSIKDGIAENPWRTIIRPFCKNSGVLSHAICAMAALHAANTQPRLRLIGTTHMTKAVRMLSAEMHDMSESHILATALALCISEGWDDRISTGIRHLNGAKTVLINALARCSKNMKLGLLSREEIVPIKFISNTFIYLDTVARLTSREEHDNIDLFEAVEAINEPMSNEIDPLMGCAATLFPLLGKVASLVHKLRKTCSNSLSIIGEANELREKLLHWEPPDIYSLEQPNDANCNVRHVLQTAEAYRRAILLHLHSAVTELSSEPSHDQAKSTLAMLAATPSSSRTMVVQIFPLLVGSCEMIQPDDRQWVMQRWDTMMKRLTLVNVASCWKIVKEVWRRRDQWIETQPRSMYPAINRNMSSGTDPLQLNHRCISALSTVYGESTVSDCERRADSLYPRQARKSCPSFDAIGDPVPRWSTVRLPRNHTDVSLLGGGVEYTVRGPLHWLGVMADWNWEVFL